jgi:adenylate cyclase class 2
MEVEQKFPAVDLAAIEVRLRAMGVSISSPKGELDLYFTHPARDFASTDEALRIRRSGGSSWITYKGPKIDATTKTRREIDLALPEGAEARAAWIALIEALGFRPIAEVSKQRRKALVEWEGRQIEVSLDRVENVGTFVELELVTDMADVARAKACIASLAESIGLSGSERRSYLELLLERRGRHEPPTQ